MKQSSVPANDNLIKPKAANADLGMEFPIDPDFLSEMPPISADALYRLNLAEVKYINTRPNAEEERLRHKCDVEFVM